MTICEIRALLLWGLAVNYVFLIIWFAVFVYAHGWLYRLHTRWFGLSTATFDAIHYAGMAVYKIGILLFNLTPLLALWLLYR